MTSTYVAQPTKQQFQEVIPWELDLYERDRIIEWCKACGAVELGGDLDSHEDSL